MEACKYDEQTLLSQSAGYGYFMPKLTIAVYVILKNPGCEVFTLLLYSRLQMPQSYTC